MIKLAKKKKNNPTKKVIAGGIILVVLVLFFIAPPFWSYNNGSWFGLFGATERPVIIPVSTEYNGEREWSNVPISLLIIDENLYNKPAIPGATVTIRGMDDSFIETGTTNADGYFDSNQLYTSKEVRKAIVGAIDSANKSHEFIFVVQGQNGDTKPSEIFCGSLNYVPVAEETEAAFAFYDDEANSLTEVNFTDDYASFILDFRIRITLDEATNLGRKMWTTYGNAECYAAICLTEYNSTTSSSIRASGSSYVGAGHPTGATVFVFKINPMAYLLKEDGTVLGENNRVHWLDVRLDFTACGIPTSYTAATALRFTMHGVVSFEYNWQFLANSGTAYNTAWFSDTDLTAIDLVT